jgi:hypothetical protein
MKELIQQYIDWLKERFTLEKIGEWYEITTPFLDPHNDYIQIYAKAEDDKILLSDGGDTLKDLELNGVYIDRSEKRKSELCILLNSFGIRRKDDELFLYSTRNNFPEVKHRLIQTILSVYDLFILAEPKIESFFIEDISTFFDEKDIRYIRTLSFTGKSGFSHQFDFSIPKTKLSPERIIKAVNSPRKDVISSLLFSFEDTKSVRPESQGIMILNDTVTIVSQDIFQALNEYDLKAIPWSKKEQYLNILAV